MIADPTETTTPPGVDVAAARADLAPLFAQGYVRELMALYLTTTPAGAERKRVVSLRTDDADDAVRFLVDADNAGAIGTYASVNPVALAVGGPDSNRPNGKNVPYLGALFLDFDVRAAKAEKRPATDAERSEAHKAAMHAFGVLERCGFTGKAQRIGRSGNGFYLLLALDTLPNDPEHRALIAAAVKALKVGVDEHYPEIDVDTGAATDVVRVRRISGTRNRSHGGNSECRLAVHNDATPLTVDLLRAVIIARTRQSDGAQHDESGPRNAGTIVTTDAENRLFIEIMQTGRDDGVRHPTALAYGGFMVHSRIARESALAIIRAVAVDDRDVADRVKAVNDSYDNHEAGKPVGWKNMLPIGIVTRLKHARRVVYARVDAHTAEADSDEADTLPPAPTWPSGILPPELDAYVVAQARAIGVPEDMVAVPMLVFAGGTIGNAVELQLKAGFSVLATLWAGVVAEPGKKKTPTMKAAQWPANVLQKRLHDEWQAAMAEYESDLQAWEAKPKAERGEKPRPPRLDHVYTTNTTLEKLVDMLNTCRGVTITHDELSGLIGGMNQYRGGKGNDRQQYLSLWAGAPMKVDRVAGGTAYATHPVGCVYGGIQPDYAKELHSRNGDRDGMVERFLLFRPDVRRSGWTDDSVDPDLLDPVVTLFASLRSIRTLTIDDVGTDAERITVKMHPDAYRLWVAWYNDNDAASDRATGLRQGFYLKLDNQLARIALILHCLHNPADPRVMLSATTMQAAIDVAEFFRGHLDRVLPLIGDHSTGAPVGLSARILRYLRTPELQDRDGWVRRSDLLHRLSNVPASDLTTELSDLERRGAVESRRADGTTKPTELWRLRSTGQSEESDVSALFLRDRATRPG